ncbi:hypothetical protein BCR41DRAFT_368571 [Lobosporangium transversale]|uniref:CNH domain-domain-containing protein n=1 Tax=Lobosporangium transversale TaxID=64571 RepID=A0A1Y2GW85_9FUNG|nr:hypothetical protein BCR41DRAFT_368571 [Lobosporangium transversale]ORZ26525.1 hypothetical protein BCR41DRAFT_368571 [Lobosporangium transversale]|eukprot:XP_021884290.1 hypothetical protein BCR41DRAFT_368571 [Lobosporangium transversale]
MYSPQTPKPASIASNHSYTPSITASSMSQDWMQLPSPVCSSGSLNTRDASHGSFSSSNFSNLTPPFLSLEAQQLLDFNPGLLSTIAVAFRQKMLNNESKRSESECYGLEFPVTFTGKEAVDVVNELTYLEDRRHGLAIARSLEAQFLFFGGGDNLLFDSNNDQYFFSDAALAFIPGKTDFPTVPTGVFPYSSKCYSYGCVPGDATCYSYLCPNRRQIGSLLGRQNSGASSLSGQEKVWANSVPASVVAAASKKERNRQEAIFEVVNTEANYVRDLELMEEIFINPLRSGDIIDPEKVEEFIEDVFLNYKEIIELNKLLLEALRARQEEQPLVEKIGDVLLSHVAGFEDAYIRYIPQIAISEFTYKREESKNPKFAQFLKDCTRHPEARRLGLRHFVGQPYQRIPRYPLLLNEVVKRTEEGIEDRETVLEVIKLCTELGKRIDACMPAGAKQLRLLTLQDRVVWKSKEDHQDLKLGERGRKLHFECIARRKTTFEVQAVDFRLFVFDHMLLMTKEKRDKQGDKSNVFYQVYKQPIPLELADVWPDEGKNAPLSLNGRPKSIVSDGSSVLETATPASSNRSSTMDTKYTAPVTIHRRGRRGGAYTLNLTLAEREDFVREVDMAKAARNDIVSGSRLFQFSTITEMSAHLTSPLTASDQSHPMDGKRITCSATFINVLDAKRRIVVGTEAGVYVGLEDDRFSFRLALKDINVTDISILEDYHLLLILSGKVLKAYNMNCLEPNADKAFTVGQQLIKNVQYFTTGVYAEKTLVITMRKKGSGDSQFSSFEPVENAVLGVGQNHQKGLSFSLGRSKSEWFKPYREFYVPGESLRLQMLSRMVCVVCPKGFEVLMLENLDKPRLYPERQDPDFAFLSKKADSVPVSMFRISSELFLMCYDVFAFTMTKTGKLAKPDLIEFEGRAESFALVYPYIIAFESQLIEIRHIETGALEQLVLGDNIRLLYSDVDLVGNAVIHVQMSDPTKGDVRKIVKLTKAPKTILEPVKYQPKSSYTPQTSISINVSSASSFQPQETSLYGVYPMAHSPMTQSQFIVSSTPQAPSPRLIQRQSIYTTLPADPLIYNGQNYLHHQNFEPTLNSVSAPLHSTPAPYPFPSISMHGLITPSSNQAPQPVMYDRYASMASPTTASPYSSTQFFGYPQANPAPVAPSSLPHNTPVSSSSPVISTAWATVESFP